MSCMYTGCNKQHTEVWHYSVKHWWSIEELMRYIFLSNIGGNQNQAKSGGDVGLNSSDE